MGLDSMGQSIYQSMPPQIADKSRCVDDGQEITFQGVLESMWHTSILIEVTPCKNETINSNCYSEFERVE